MKKFFCLCLSLVLLLSFSFDTYASSQTIIFLNDGSYLITTLEDTPIDDGITLSSVESKSKSKTIKHYNANNQVMWQATVTGTFSYGKGTAKCTKSTVSAKSFVSEWKITDKSSSISKNSALAKVTAKQYLNSTVINIINKTLQLTCSPTGEFS